MKKIKSPKRKDSSRVVTAYSDGYWEYFEAVDDPQYEITGKYLFISEDRGRASRMFHRPSPYCQVSPDLRSCVSP